MPWRRRSCSVDSLALLPTSGCCESLMSSATPCCSDSDRDMAMASCSCSGSTCSARECSTMSSLSSSSSLSWYFWNAFRMSWEDLRGARGFLVVTFRCTFVFAFGAVVSFLTGSKSSSEVLKNLLIIPEPPSGGFRGSFGNRRIGESGDFSRESNRVRLINISSGSGSLSTRSITSGCKAGGSFGLSPCSCDTSGLLAPEVEGLNSLSLAYLTFPLAAIVTSRCDRSVPLRATSGWCPLASAPPS
uniref:(northern house mosquito) hypothetical protein n=1 Tax=Culex pipiens TaxID=7175 RepID=A0A8D8ANS3_CULPI